jgi:MFS family permease
VPRVFYGWWIVAASSLCISANPGQFALAALGMFVVPLGAEFGWSRGAIMLSLTFFTIALAVATPVVGRLVDVYGARHVMMPSLFVFGALLIGVGAGVAQLWHLWLGYFAIGTLAAGANAVPHLRIVSAWFDRRRGLALGLVMAGGGLGNAYMPPLVHWVMEHGTWRHAYAVLGTINLAVMLPLAFLVMRESPRPMGLRPDGAAAPSLSVSADPATGRSAREAMATPIFWALFALFVLASFGLYGALAHLLAMLTDRGMPRAQAALVASVVGWAILAARIVVGLLFDRFHAARIGALCFLLSAAGLAHLAGGAADATVYLSAIGLGVSLGAEVDLLAFLAGRYFGLRCFGQIYGLLFAAFLIGTGTGPVAFGAAFDLTGSYRTILWIGVASLLLAAGLSLGLPRYPRG